MLVMPAFGNDAMFNLIEESADPVFILDYQGRVVFANVRTRALLGRDYPEGENFASFIGADGQLALDEALATVRCGERGEIARVVIRGARHAALSVSYSPAPGGMFCIAHEITGASDTETDLWLKGKALAAVGDAVIICDALLPNLPVRYVNPAFTAMTGYTEKQAIGRDARMLEGPGTAVATVERVCEAFADGRRFESELRAYRSDGTAFRARMTIVPVYRQGNLTHFVISVRELSGVPA